MNARCLAALPLMVSLLAGCGDDSSSSSPGTDAGSGGTGGQDGSDGCPTVCDDGNDCNGLETCVEGACQGADDLADGSRCSGPSSDQAYVCSAGQCQESQCGDGFVDPFNAEVCDDGNTTPDDGCEPDCLSTVGAVDPDNVITLKEREGVAVTDVPVQLGRPFARGEIATHPQALVNGTPVLTQADVKSRWEDGSVKHAILAFVVSEIPANGSMEVTFQAQAEGKGPPNPKLVQQPDVVMGGMECECV